MGRRDIAELLLSRGARLDLFAAAMLGELEIVRTTLDAFPELVSAKGPHGIPLRVHAEKGGEQAQAVLDAARRALRAEVAVQELACLGQQVAAKRVDLVVLVANRDEAGMAEDREVVVRGRLRDAELRGRLAQGERALAQPPQHAQPALVA